MIVTTKKLALKSKAEFHIIDMTEEVARFVTESKLTDGIVNVHSWRSTCGVTTVEYEPGLAGDLERLYEELAPRRAAYGHEERWHDDNGHSHVRSSITGTSQAFNVIDGELQMYPWQQIAFLDFAPEGDPKEVTLVAIGQ